MNTNTTSQGALVPEKGSPAGIPPKGLYQDRITGARAEAQAVKVILTYSLPKAESKKTGLHWPMALAIFFQGLAVGG